MKHANNPDMSLSDTIKNHMILISETAKSDTDFWPFSSKLGVLHKFQKNRFQVGQISNRLIITKF